MSTGEIEVRVREADEGRSRRLTSWAINDLDSVLTNLRAWGLAYDDGNGLVNDNFYGQFVDDGTNVFFEVVYS